MRQSGRFPLILLSAVSSLVAATGITSAQCPLQLFAIDGTTTDDQLGHSLAGMGDVNGDGLEDWVVGAPFADPGALASAGQVTLISGATGSPIFTLSGTGANESVGYAVANAGDVDGDGTPDLIVGAPNFSSVGTARVFSGTSGALLFTLTGSGTGDYFGSSVSTAGDVNSDGTPDLIVGAPAASGGTGYVTLFSGLSGAALLTISGMAAVDYFGLSVAGVGDVSGDAVPDLLVGAPYADPFGFSDAGLSRVFSGADGAIVLTLIGTTAGDNFGLSVAGVGDLNGDSVPDCIVGAPRTQTSGIAYV